MSELHWPDELAGSAGFPGARFIQPGSNICLDLHGDPQRARLKVFSDGNHHMALEEALQAFIAQHPRLGEVFYATAPPRLIIEALLAGGVQLGNLSVTVTPHVFISPPKVLDRLVAGGHMQSHRAFARNRGCALLVCRGNPANIRSIVDLARQDVRVFLSNPRTESISYEAYAASLRSAARREALELDILDPAAQNKRVVYGESIHHREAPQCVAAGRADVAVIYHHLALRYVRIFPEVFEMVRLGAEEDSGHAEGALHIGMIGDGGEWGGGLVEFMTSHAVGAIYDKHGLAAA